MLHHPASSLDLAIELPWPCRGSGIGSAVYAVAPFFNFGNWAASDQVQGGEAEGEGGEMHCAFAGDW